MSLIVNAKEVKEGPRRFEGVVGRPLMNADLGSKAVAMSVLTIEPGGTLPVHIHTDEEAFFVIEGEGIAIVNGEEHVIRPETALLASAGHPHGFTNRTDKLVRIVCMHPVGKPNTTFLES